MNKQPLLIALTGLPGAGKSTSAKVIGRMIEMMGRKVAQCSIGKPLYDVQRQAYARMGTELEIGQQDGELLNFFGAHIRKIRPPFMMEDFARRCRYLYLLGHDTIVCDDARPIDLQRLQLLGFKIVEIKAPDDLRRARKLSRADATIGDDQHITEKGEVSIHASVHVVNDKGFDDLDNMLREVVVKWSSQPATSKDQIEWITDRDAAIHDLVGEATAYISERYVEERHQIGAAVLCQDGSITFGLHLEAGVGRASICAEAMALGRALELKHTTPQLIVAVRHPKPSEEGNPRVVPPCGLCRELLLDYNLKMKAILHNGLSHSIVEVASLLPAKYVPSKWKQAT
ncbi:hypothetical protein N2599_37175 (plasmid) [Rhizobium sullae]|uniref:CMP/dCMP-type deaminase domain-containing protein n=1 Tax=Rhizobium sullae TaxID=50338 RepID=A0ABY5XXV3_RHISU|nr:hypothetical protein [Rhizobium sullae]UWU19474.1 hypothetical protein N2599_37175 [Rhizobium sullae]